MTATPRSLAAYARLGMIAVLCCCSRESCGVIFRFNDGFVSQDFSVTSADTLKPLLKLMADQADIRATPGIFNTGSIKGILDTSDVKRLVGGFPVSLATPTLIAQAAGFHTFAWVSNIIGEPGIRREVNGSSKTVVSPPILDPIKNYAPGSHYYEIENAHTGQKKPVGYDELYFGDNHDPYWNEEWALISSPDPWGPYLDFFDAPKRPAGWFNAGEKLQFRTELVAVNSNFDPVARWTGIGINFTWKTNGEVDGDIAYDSVSEDDPQPTLISGGISEVVQDFQIAGDFNVDGRVDAADYVVWRKNDGTPTEYAAWRTSFGQSTGRGASASDSAVPEPTSLVLIVASGMILSGRRFP